MLLSRCYVVWYIDEFSSDDDDEQVIIAAAPPAGQVVLPVVRLRPGYSLLQDPLTVAADLFSVDPLELARQWTITDHALFAAIPLHSLVPTIDAGNMHCKSGSSSAVYSQPRYQQMRRGVLGSGLCGGARTFIDRFNALSNWVAYSVLMLLPVDLRADRVAFFIRVASHLEELDNYNGLMIILTALNQGCITRLQHTFALLKPADHSVLSRLNKLMSGAKNYQAYRSRCQVKQAFRQTSSDSPVPGPAALFLPSPLPSFRERGRSRPVRRSGPPAAEEASTRAPIWKAEILDRYAVSRLYEQQRLCEQVRTQRAQEQQQHIWTNTYPSSTLNKHKKKSPQAATASSSSSTAMVPHLGAHLAELTTIEEGNPDYLSDAPHLFNLDKCGMLATSLSSLSAMQQLPPYQLQPVRCLMATLNYFARLHCRLSVADSAAYSKKLFNRSLAVEPMGISSEQVMQSRSKQAQWMMMMSAGRAAAVQEAPIMSQFITRNNRNNSRAANGGVFSRSVGNEEDEEDDDDEEEEDEDEGDIPVENRVRIQEQNASSARSLLSPFKKLINKLTPTSGSSK